MIQLTLPGYIVAGSVYALYHAVAALIAPNGPWRVIGRPAAHTLAEALRFSFPFGGVPLAIHRHLAGRRAVPRRGQDRWCDPHHLGDHAARIRPGRPGRAAPAFVRRTRPPATRSPHGIVGLAVVLIVVVLSFVAPTGRPTGESLSIAAVQGGGEQGTSALEVPSSLVTERHLAATRSIPDDADLDLVLWPENTIDVVTFAESDVLAAIAVEAERLDAPIAVGVTEDSADGTHSSTPRSWWRPTAPVRPLREGSSRAVRRVRPAALLARIARCAGRPDPPRRGRRAPGPQSSTSPTAPHSASSSGGRCSSAVGPRGREARRRGDPQPDERIELHRQIVQTQQVASRRLRRSSTAAGSCRRRRPVSRR